CAYNDETIRDSLSQVFRFNEIKYAWYINMYIGLALLIPFLNRLWQGLTSRREFHFLLLVLFIISAIPSFWNLVPNLQQTKVVYFPDYWRVTYPLLYYFLGVYIRRYAVKVSWKICLGGYLLVTT